MSAQPTLVAAVPDAESFGIAPVTEIIAELRAGRIVILVDEEDRENEGDLVMAAEFVDARGHQFHGHPWARPGLPDADRRTPPPA